MRPATFVQGFHDEEAVEKMKYRPLGQTGLAVSVIGLGGGCFSGMYGPVELDTAVAVVRAALKSGINYIDTAPHYGKSEEVIGQALKGIPRESYYIATKLCRFGRLDFDFSAERVFESMERSLQRLGVEYVDLIQIHDFEFAPNLDIILNETLPALQKLKETGKARFIGINNYPLDNYRNILDATTVKIDTILSYCHSTLEDNSLPEYIPYFKEKGVGIINAAPISMGLLGPSGPPDWHPCSSEIKEACAGAVQYCQERLVNICRLAVKFALQQDGYCTTLVSCHNLDILKTNLDCLYSELTPVETVVTNEIIEKFFTPLKKKTWENVEVEKYWKLMDKRKET